MGSGFAQDGFGGYLWGTLKDSILANEKYTIIEQTNNRVKYHGDLNGIDATIIYVFENDSLSSGAYIIDKAFENDVYYYQNYRRIIQLLTSKYGKPDEDTEIWYKHLPKGDPDGDAGFAVAIKMRFMELYANWTSLTNGTIYMRLFCQDNNLKLTIDYDSHNDRENRILNNKTDKL